jgi:1-acyl-sn-glycerol-3-phosphate acyltransferase
MASPKYSYPPGLFAALIRDIFLYRKRDFHKDAKACIANLNPPLNVIGKENIPQQGPCVIMVNHYHREGFGAEWLALAIAALVPIDMYWVITGEFMYQGRWYQVIGSKGSRILLKRIAQVYGFTTMPPMPPRAKDVQERAASVRAVLDYVKHSQNPILGLAPEGYDTPEGILTRPARGLGRFACLLSKAGLKFTPVGAYEADGVFHIQFGEPYTLSVLRDISSDEKDAQASQIIMENIARLLPVHLRGEFA